MSKGEAMKSLSAGALTALAIGHCDQTLAQQRDHVEAIRLTASSLGEIIAAVLSEDYPLRVEKGATIPRGCPARDLAVMIMIEALGRDGAVGGEVLHGALLMAFDARELCLAGRPSSAFAKYDGALAMLREAGEGAAARLLDASHR